MEGMTRLCSIANGSWHTVRRLKVKLHPGQPAQLVLAQQAKLQGDLCVGPRFINISSASPDFEPRLQKFPEVVKAKATGLPSM
jgi:hypothetical protein